jgi:phosphate transport system substrate-binding protein
MSDGGTFSDAGDIDAAFAREAESAGLVLPAKHRVDPWEALVVAVAIVVVAAGIGTAAGWLNFRTSTPTTGGGFETPTCTVPRVVASGTVSPALDPSFSAWLSGAAVQLSQAAGGCFEAQLGSGSGDGYAALSGGARAEFVATYSAPSSGELAQLEYPVAVVPVALGAVAFVYNIPGAPTGLNLSASVLAGIYSGTIDSWNDPAVAAVNPGVQLAGAPPISVFHEAGTAESSQAVAQFLGGGNSTWAGIAASGSSVNWPIGTEVANDAVMAEDVGSTPGAVGFVTVVGSPPSGVGVANVEDAAGNFTPPNPATVWVAADSLSTSPAVASGNWSGFSLIGTTAAGGYPVDTLSYFAMYHDLGTAFGGSLNLTSATWLLSFVYWLTGLETAAPLPPAYVAETLSVLNNETYYGTPIVHLDNENGETGGETGEF